MYVVEFLFDKKSEDTVNCIWKDLIELNINNEIEKMEGLRPHITIGVYDEINESDFIKIFKEYKKSFKPIKLNFDTIGVFPATKTCFIKPTVTVELLNEHKRFHDFLSNYNFNCSEYYIPNKWNPHCTLGLKLEKENILNIISFMLDKFEKFEANIVDIAVLKIDFHQNNYSNSYQIC